MTKLIDKKEYLCGIGHYKTRKVNKYEVGRYDESRKSFHFSNGSYAFTELFYRKPISSNSTTVLTTKPIAPCMY